MSKCVQCCDCQHTGWSKPKGSGWITLVLAFFFLVPAIVYEIWRRSGNGVCEQCGSQKLIKSEHCTQKPSFDLASTLGLLAVAVIGAFSITLGYAMLVGGPAESAQELENECMTQGLKHYQNLGQYPTLATGEETSTHVLSVCKNTKDGRFKTE